MGEYMGQRKERAGHDLERGYILAVGGLWLCSGKGQAGQAGEVHRGLEFECGYEGRHCAYPTEKNGIHEPRLPNTRSTDRPRDVGDFGPYPVNMASQPISAAA